MLASARTALVIGNSDYASAPLDNPVNDATDIATKLRQLDFNVNVLIDASRRDMRRAIREYSENLRTTGGVGLFYYAGHGMQIKGVNYLIPTDAIMQNEFEIPDEAVAANSILRALEEADNDLNIVILDACRDNPFAKSYRSAATRGLARMDAPGGSIIAYATAPGDVALDGDGRNGVYTKHLLANLDKPGMPIEQMFKKVRIGVIDDSDGQQTPWEESSLRSDFYFSPARILEVTIPKDNKETQTLSSEPVKLEPAPTLAAQGVIVAPQSGPAASASDEVQQTIEVLLAKAAKAMNDYRLTTPEQDNALYYYRETLKVDPVSFEAHNGLQMITHRYITLAEHEIRNKDPEKANRFITRGLNIQPENHRLRELQREADEMNVEHAISSQQTVISTANPTEVTAPASVAVVQKTPERVAVISPQSAEKTESDVEAGALTTEGENNEQSTDQVTMTSTRISHTERMKSDIKRDVDEFKNSILFMGKSIKSGLGGMLQNKKHKDNDDK